MHQGLFIKLDVFDIDSQIQDGRLIRILMAAILDFGSQNTENQKRLVVIFFSIVKGIHMPNFIFVT